MDIKFYNLNTTSYYSLLSSSLSLDDIISYAINKNQSHVILTDWNLIGCYEFYFKAIQNNLKPVIGLNYIYKNSHYLFIAKNNNGFHNLIKIHSMSNLNKEYEIANYINDLYIIHISGSDVIKSSSYYLAKELAYHEVKVKTFDDQIVIDILNAIKNETLLSDVDKSCNNFFLSDDEARKKFNSEQIKLTYDIVTSCNWVLEDIKPRLAKYSVDKSVNSKQILYQQCLEGLKRKVGKKSSNIDKIYVDRINYELSVIDEMGYNDYFLIVADFVNYAKSKKILVGPGRGSAAGSLVSYCLNITDVDPIKYNLIFERFLNISRKSLPDIDIDIMDTRRQEVIDYIFDKYGPDKTSYIMTLQKIKAKMAIRDIGRILNIDLPIVDKITKLITPEQEENLELCFHDERFQQYVKEYPLLFEYANKIINTPRQVSTHAAGIIISDKPLYEYIPIQVGIDQWQLTEITMDYLETLGLFKMDILGLKNLSIINDVLELIRINKGIDVNLSEIDLDDKKLFDDLSSGNTIGIFQLESPGMRNTVMKIKPRSIEDISICSALFRPGPQSLIPDFVKTREGKLKPKYINEQLIETFEPTLGFCIYQEQVIELIRSVTNFNLSEADIFRRAISKKKEELFIKMRESFTTAAMANGYSSDEANKIYDFILEFANYGFNHSHSLAYSFVSYQMMYLKYHYPLEFYLTLLMHGDSTKNNLYISQAKKKLIKIYNVSILNSKQNFSIFDNGIIFGFSNIKGIGNEIAKKIIEVKNKYNFHNWQDAISILSRQGINRKTLDLLIKVGAFDEFNVDRNFLLLNLEEIIDKSSISFGNEKSVFDIDINNDYEPMSEIDKANYEYELLSYTFSNNEFDKVFEKYHHLYDLKNINDSTYNENDNVLIYVKNLKERMTKYNKKMCFIEFSQKDTDFSCASFSEPIFSKLIVNKYVVVKLKIANENKIQLVSVVESLEE